MREVFVEVGKNNSREIDKLTFATKTWERFAQGITVYKATSLEI